jgi:hypothetical protein
MLTPPFIMSAQHVHSKVRTEADYRARQRETIAGNQRAYPNLPWLSPWASLEKPDGPFVSAGTWMAECTCKNGVTLAPGWGNQPDSDHVYALGLCYECGAVYEGLQMPNAMVEIERVLVQQPNLAYRYWNPRMSVADLEAALVDPATIFRFTQPEDHR